jgi:hypothetical protein
VILEILVIVLIIFFSFIAMILLIPFHVKATGSTTLSSMNFEVKFSWLGITIWKSKSKDEEKKKPKLETKTRTKRNPVQVISLIWKSYPAIEKLLISLRRAVQIKRLSADLSFGTGDPADTAILAGYLWSAVGLLDGAFPSVSVSLRPNLEASSFDSSLDAEVAVRIGFVAVGFLRAYIRRPFRQLIREVRTSA